MKGNLWSHPNQLFEIILDFFLYTCNNQILLHFILLGFDFNLNNAILSKIIPMRNNTTLLVENSVYPNAIDISPAMPIMIKKYIPNNLFNPITISSLSNFVVI